MGEGNLKKAGADDAAHKSPEDLAAGVRAAALSESAWRPQALEVRPLMVQAQSQTPGSEGIGPKGTFGAPALPPIESKAAPAAPQDSSGFHLPRPADTAAAAAPAAPGQFVPIPFDVDKRVGGSPKNNLPDDWAKIGGTVVGGIATYSRWSPEIHKRNTWTPPTYDVAPNVAQSTIDTFEHARIPAHGFLKAESDRLVKYVKANIDPDPAMQTAADMEIVARKNAVQAARDATSPVMTMGVNPNRKVDFTELARDPAVTSRRSWSTVADLDAAQTALITERQANIAALRTRQQSRFEAEIAAARRGRINDFGALMASQATNVGIDYFIERNTKSPVTAVVDFVAPAIMLAKFTPLGKYAPLLKYGVIVGSHLISHLAFDEQVPELTPPKT